MSSSLFPRGYISEPSTSLAEALFPFLDLNRLDKYQQVNSNKHHHRSGTMKSFVPNFDVREIGEAYELHGELPGIDQKDIEIEFTDNSTLSIKGHTEQSSTSSSNGPHGFKKAAVEDADAPADETTSTEVTKAPEKAVGAQAPEPKYWISERNVGEFARTFSFPVPIDQEGVQASMKNGVLSVVVPKATKSQSRKITIT